MILEIRTYRLKPGSTTGFLGAMRTAVGLLESFGIAVVGYGSSLVAEDGHEEAYLIRAFASLSERDEQEERFYGSEAWRKGPRGEVLSRIVDYHTVVIDASEEAVAALRPRS